MPRRASSRGTSLLSSGPVAMRWMIERISPASCAPAVSFEGVAPVVAPWAVASGIAPVPAVALRIAAPGAVPEAALPPVTEPWVVAAGITLAPVDALRVVVPDIASLTLPAAG